MQSTKIKENEDYAYVRTVGRSAPEIPTHGVQRVRVLEKGCIRQVRDEWGYEREGARRDGIRVQFLNDDGALTDRVSVVRSKNLRCEWLTYRIATREREQRQQEERAIRERQEAARKARSARIHGRLTDLGVTISDNYWNRKGNDVVEYGHDDWRFSADGIEKLIDLIPDHIIAARLAEQEIVEQIADERVAEAEAELVEA